MEREITMNGVSETESQEKNYSLKVTFTEWFVNLQALGVPMVFKRKDLILKLIWLVSFLVSLIYCSYSVVSLIIRKYMDISVIRESPVIFPMVSFCNIKALNFNVISEH
jgi:hypothetical protein